MKYLVTDLRITVQHPRVHLARDLHVRSIFALATMSGVATIVAVKISRKLPRAGALHKCTNLHHYNDAYEILRKKKF